MIYIYTLTDIYRLSRMGTVLVVNKTSILRLYKVDSTFFYSFIFRKKI